MNETIKHKLKHAHTRIRFELKGTNWLIRTTTAKIRQKTVYILCMQESQKRKIRRSQKQTAVIATNRLHTKRRRHHRDQHSKEAYYIQYFSRARDIISLSVLIFYVFLCKFFFCWKKTNTICCDLQNTDRTFPIIVNRIETKSGKSGNNSILNWNIILFMWCDFVDFPFILYSY